MKKNTVILQITKGLKLICHYRDNGLTSYNSLKMISLFLVNSQVAEHLLSSCEANFQNHWNCQLNMFSCYSSTFYGYWLSNYFLASMPALIYWLFIFYVSSGTARCNFIRTYLLKQMSLLHQQQGTPSLLFSFYSFVVHKVLMEKINYFFLIY